MPGKIFHHTPPLPAFAWPGGYPIYYVTAEGFGSVRYFSECAECATKSLHRMRDPEEFGQVKSVDGDVHWEGPPMECESCGVEIESAYGDPAAPAEEGDGQRLP